MFRWGLAVIIFLWTLLGGNTGAQATFIIYSHPSDGTLFSNSASPAVTSQVTNVGITHTDGQRSAAIFVFQLPANLLWDEVLSVQLNFYLAGKTNRPLHTAPVGNLDVSVLPLMRSSPSIIAQDYAAPATLVQNDVVTPASPLRQWYTVQGDALTQAVRYALAADYAQTHRCLLVRISYDAPVGSVALPIQYYTLNTSEAGQSLAPKLIIEPTHHPEPGTLMLMLFTSAAALQRRRQTV